MKPMQDSDCFVLGIQLHVRPGRLLIEEDIHPSSHSQRVLTCTRFVVCSTEFPMCDPARGQSSKESLGQYGD